MDYNYSIIVPYRDKYELFVKAVDSIPDREDIQVIIVDNAPQSLDVADVPTKSKATGCYTTSSPYKGAGCARNEGLKHVRGKFTLFLDADDYFLPAAFDAFDKYLDEDYDIVYFMADSISLVNGQRGSRHENINRLVSTYLNNSEEGLLRYKFINPISKLIRSSFIADNGISFEEIPVSNDVWFSVVTGHTAKRITAESTAVYMITTGEAGSSLTQRKSPENWFIRYQAMVRVNKYLKSVGEYKYRIRLKGALRIALKDYGIREFFRFVKYAIDNKVGVL